MKYDLKIVSREGVIFNGVVESVTSYNEAGKFDILPMHANFISLIYDKITIRLGEDDVRELEIGSALLRNKDGKLEIYIGVEEFAERQSHHK